MKDIKRPLGAGEKKVLVTKMEQTFQTCRERRCDREKLSAGFSRDPRDQHPGAECGQNLLLAIIDPHSVLNRGPKVQSKRWPARRNRRNPRILCTVA